jgi:AcrR family transcriptional regulator
MSAEDRRRHIVDTARKLFAERPYGEVSTQDIADSAGVARSLVHHYFRGIKDVFFAVAASGGSALVDQRTAGVETPLGERLAFNAGALLDVVEANRETYMAVMGQVTAVDPEVNTLLEAVRERSVERMLEANADVVRDTPQVRVVLRGFQEYAGVLIRAWLAGDLTRPQAQSAMTTGARVVMLEVVPALDRG